MDKFLSHKRTFDDNKASTSAQTSIVPKIKSRKYSQEYLNFEFTITEVNGEEKPLCVIYSKILAADSMKPNKLKRHFETLHAIEIVETMFGDNFAKELQSIPLSNDTVSRRIDDVEQQLFGKLRDKLFSIQLDEATDSNKDVHFIAYVRFWDEEENLPEAEKFRDGLFLMKLSYLVDIFEKLNILNLQLQGSNVHMFDTRDKINAFCRKLELWSRNLKQKNLEMLENADKCVKTYKTEEQHVEVVYKTIEYHLAMLAKNFKKYFFAEDNLIASYEWVRDPFQNTPEGFSSTEEESFIDFTSSGEIKRQFCNKTLFQFWAEVDEFSELKTKAFRILLPFSTSYLSETGFSAVAALKTKYRSQLNIEKELRVSISNIKPSFENLCSARQAHGSH
ncbi:zinc finger BED domain-containing protein 5 [Trichonephila clavipes]|uniref:Zinc finger BED domain-containing protein 5 n=1 Tax=Trichonephila clavipes TaxID=2585209 RepID=A0A8X7BMY1_TRICX|nr:zinc finger BED domain-containing protein 5 [Trichonephila clavipes]